jgi:hypothetical protein
VDILVLEDSKGHKGQEGLMAPQDMLVLEDSLAPEALAQQDQEDLPAV